jgi:hypothetical protein
MLDRPTRFFRALALLLALLLLAEAAGGALAVVRLRQQEAGRAQAMRDLERGLADAGRQLRSLDAQVDEACQPEFLRAHASPALGPPLPRQIVWVRPAPLARPETPAVPRLNLQLASLDPALGPATPR